MITFYARPEGVYLLIVFGKGEKASLTGAEKNALAHLTAVLKG